MDSLNLDHDRSKDTTQNRTLLSVYEGDRMLLTLTKATDNSNWMISAPSDVEDQFLSENMSNAIRALVAFLPSVVDPAKLDTLIGPADVVNTFIETWVASMQERGVKLKASNPLFTMQVAYATLATIPPPSSAFSQYKVEQVLTEKDVDVIAPLAIELATRGPKTITLDAAKRALRAAVKMRQLWICRLDGEIAGYSMTGRVTDHTIALRNVYVSPKYRRRGIAEAMVRAVTRFYLGAEPLGFDGASSGKPNIGVRDEICLNVAEEAVARLYKRCGFLLGDGERDPVTGRRGSISMLWRGVEAEKPEQM